MGAANAKRRRGRAPLHVIRAKQDLGVHGELQILKLELKLLEFQRYHNGHRAHAGLEGRTPEPSTEAGSAVASVRSYRWQSHCRGLDQTPMAA
jgi:hypothetical protein